MSTIDPVELQKKLRQRAYERSLLTRSAEEIEDEEFYRIRDRFTRNKWDTYRRNL